jgi:hypothetical protein
MPWRRKPASHLQYWSGSLSKTKTGGFKSIMVHCCGPAELPKGYHSRCHHNGRINLADLPDWDWYDISAHLKCTKCGSVGWVATRLDWSEVINFDKGVCS